MHDTWTSAACLPNKCPNIFGQAPYTEVHLLCALRGGGLSAVYDALGAQGLMPFVMTRHIILMR